MGKDKQIFINIISQTIGFIINLGIHFFLTPFIVKYIGVIAYGFLGLANDFIGYAQVITIALNSMVARFITIEIQKGNIENANKYFTSIVAVNFVISIVFFLIGGAVIVCIDSYIDVPIDMLNDIRMLWILIFLNFIISVMTSVYNVTTFVKNRLDIASIIGIKSNLLKVIILLILFGFFNPVIWYIGCAALSCTIFTAVQNLKYTKFLLPELAIEKKYFSLEAIKNLFFSGIWNTFNRLSGILSNGLNLMIANLYIGVEQMGILAIAKIIPMVILSIFSMLASAFAPQLTISYANSDFEDIKKQLLLSMKILGMIASVPMAILFVYGDAFYSLWVPTQDAKLLQMLSIASCLEFVFVLQQEGMWNLFTAKNKIRFPAVFLFINSIITLGIIFIFINKFDSNMERLLLIAGTSSCIGIIRGLTFLPMYGAKCLNVPMLTFYPAIFYNVVASCILFIIAKFIKNLFVISAWWQFIGTSLLIAIIGLFINSFLVLNNYERSKLKNLLFFKLIQRIK